MMKLTRLPSGLTVATDHMAHVDSAALGVWVAAGARSEAPPEHGVAHFLEHMAFKGTRRRTARQISEAIETVGGEINAATSIETTAYHARVLADDVPLALDILSDIVTEPLFATDDIERERNVILQEIGAAEDVPEDRAFDAFPETAFRAQPLGRRILGTRGSVEGIDEGALRGFFKRHYHSGAMTVVAAGAIDHDAFVDAASEAFSGVPDASETDRSKAAYTGGHYTEDADTVECQWLLGYEGRAASHPSAVVAQLAAVVLGGGMSSRLFQSLREERGLVYDTSAFHWAFADTGLFAIHFATEPATVAAAAEVVAAELQSAARNVDDNEFGRARAQMKAGLLMSRESCASRMAQAARNALVHGRVVDKSERIAELEAVTPADVRDFLASLTSGPPTLVTVGADAASARASLFGGAEGVAA
ncbi:MAG: pitrilysin family protein [Pseudomonadota bacterium]